MVKSDQQNSTKSTHAQIYRVSINHRNEWVFDDRIIQNTIHHLLNFLLNRSFEERTFHNHSSVASFRSAQKVRSETLQDGLRDRSDYRHRNRIPELFLSDAAIGMQNKVFWESLEFGVVLGRERSKLAGIINLFQKLLLIGIRFTAIESRCRHKITGSAGR